MFSECLTRSRHGGHQFLGHQIMQDQSNVICENHCCVWKAYVEFTSIIEVFLDQKHHFKQFRNFHSNMLLRIDFFSKSGNLLFRRNSTADTSEV